MVSGHVFLVGFMGAGKSTVARRVSGLLDRPLVDIDERIEAEQDTTISEIFAAHGEERFRELESAALASLEDAEPAVVACGGGVVIDPGNRALLGRLGHVIYLEVSAEEAIARVGNGHSRPLLSGPGGALAATSLLEARAALYRSVADGVVDTVGLSTEQVADQVIAEVARLEAVQS
jgi:shikimate kinase